MKKVININFQGRVVPIEENAYDILKQYIESLRRYFAEEEGKEEIINDIESRIAELFGEQLKKGSTCITDEDVNNIIKSMGRPEDFDDEEANLKSQLGGKQKGAEGNSQQSFNYGPRRLYRDESNKVLGGVCSGIANYFGIDPLVIRILAVVSFGISFVPYLVLWIAIPSTATQIIGSTRKRLLRDMDDKIIGGVCSGLGHYFGVKVWIPRVLFLIPFLSFVTHWHHWGFNDFPNFVSLSFSPGATLLYIILWMILPEAVTAADKLEMKGERVDLNSIKNTIQTDMEGFKGRAEKFGEELKTKAEEIGKEFAPRAQKFGSEVAYAANKTGGGLGGLIILLIKIFAYFILSMVSLAIILGLFALGVAFIGISPALNYLYNNNWETVLAWLSVILLIWAPIVGIITYFVRRITKAKRNSSIVRITFVALTIIGFISLAFALVSLKNNFRFKGTAAVDSVRLENASVNKLEIKLSGYGGKRDLHWFKLQPFEGIDGDTIFVPNTDVRIVKANGDKFEVTVLRASNGRSKTAATDLANKIVYSITQKDTILSLYKGIPINTTDKFRNQRVIITIAVPVGKRIKIDDKIGWRTHFDVKINDEIDWKDEYTTEDNLDWDANREYLMTEKGLVLTGNDDNNFKKNIDKDEDLNSRLDELRRDIEEKQKDMDEKKRELKDQIDEQQKELDEKKRELKLNADSTNQKAKIQKTVAAPKLMPREKENDIEETPSIMNTI